MTNEEKPRLNDMKQFCKFTYLTQAKVVKAQSKPRSDLRALVLPYLVCVI